MVSKKSTGKKLFRNVLLVGFSFVFSLISPLTVAADRISSSKLYEYAQNNILFYNPGNEPECSNTVSNGTYMGQQYSLTEAEVAGLARAAQNENNCSMTAFKNELSIMANLYEKNGEGQGIARYVSELDSRGKSWFAKSTRDAYADTSISVSEEQLSAVREVLIQGKRTLPPQIREHDCLGDIEWIETDGVKKYATDPGHCSGTGLTDKSLYVSGKTKIKNVYGSLYVFYEFIGGGANGCGDPIGYFEDNPPVGGSYSSVTNANVNYAGAQVWTDAQLQAIQNNKAIYEEAANMYGFPWQVMAVLHWRESDLVKKNYPSQWDSTKSEGVYQLHSWAKDGIVNYPVSDSLTEAEFRQQTLDAAKFVSQMGVGDLNNADNVKKLFYRYNGTSSYYHDKAIAMGFTEEQANNGEGSDYVMNRYDARRDPTSSSMSPLWKGTYVRDNTYDPDATSERFGSFVKYMALGVSVNDGSGGANMYCSSFIGSGGTVFETAVALAKVGKDNGTGSYYNDTEPSAAYQIALDSYGAATPCRGAGDCAPRGASCDQFVATVMIYSGADPDFPRISPPAQRTYMFNHPEKYQQIPNNHDFSVLQPGDILVSAGNEAGQRHIFFYGGLRDGVQTQIGASYGQHTGYIYKFWDSTWRLNGFEYYIFRLIQ